MPWAGSTYVLSKVSLLSGTSSGGCIKQHLGLACARMPHLVLSLPRSGMPCSVSLAPLLRFGGPFGMAYPKTVLPMKSN